MRIVTTEEKLKQYHITLQEIAGGLFIDEQQVRLMTGAEMMAAARYALREEV